MSGFELFQLSQQMRATPEFHRLQELDRFSNTLAIFEANYRELDRLMAFICESPAGDKLFRPENHFAWEQSMHEVIRLLHNFVSAVSALVDHSRRLYRRMYKPTRLFPEYENEVKQRFVDSEIIQFVQGLRDYCLHYRTPSIGTTMTLMDIKQEKFVKAVTLSKRDLLDFDWNAAAKRFLADAPEQIDLRTCLSQYHGAIDDFYKWFSQQVRALHAADYDAVSRTYAVLLSAKKQEHEQALEERLKAFEAGLGTPYDVLNPFMTPNDASEIASHIHDPDAWIDVGLERVAKYVSVEATVAPRLHVALHSRRRPDGK